MKEMETMNMSLTETTSANNQALQIFENNEFGSLEVVMIDGKPHFPATDCARVLGYKDTINAIKQHCKGVVKHHLPTNGGIQAKNLIPEGDLYRLIARSKLPAAERFEQWVFDEVVPSISKYGAYMTPETMRNIRQSPQFIYTLMQDLESEQEKTKALETKIEQDKPLVDFANAVSDTSDLISVEKMAKLLFDEGYPTGRNKYFSWLRAKGYLTDKNLPYQKYIDAGYFKVREVFKDNVYGGKVFAQTMITGRGQIYLAKKFRQDMQKTARNTQSANLLNTKRGINHETNTNSISTIH